MDAHVLAVLRRSALRTLSDQQLEALARDGLVVDFPRGGQPHRPGATPVPMVVLSGLIRVFLIGTEGRQVTIRYAREGALLDIAPFFSTIMTPGGTEALTASQLFIFRPSIVIELTRRDPLVTNAMLVEASDRAMSWVSEIEGRSFSSLRQRVVRHLLDVATSDEIGDGLVAHLSQQELADAVGTLREVVVRILHDLRQDGLILTARNEVRLVDPARLHDLTFPLTAAP
jgi:CRP/FNR family transcriptional regulator, cyclic AMP receptor protein